MAMESYTSMSNEGIEATIRKMEESGEKFRMELNRSDFAELMWTLQVACDSPEATEETADWASGFASSMAETLGIEFI